MNILFLANHFNAGGISTYLLTLSRGLISKGHQVFIVTGGGELVRDAEALGIRHITAALHVKCEISPQVFLAVPRLVDLVRREKIDIIHAQTRTAQMCALCLSFLTKRPFVTTCHGFFRLHLGRRLFPMWGEKVIAISYPVYDHLHSDFCVPEEKIRLVFNGLDTEKFKLSDESTRRTVREAWGIKDEPVIGIIARLSDVKGHVWLIEAIPEVLRSFPNAKCFIIGAGPLERRLKDLVRSKDLGGAINFHDVVNRTAEIFPLFDVFVMPSIQEGLGLSVMEAGAAGLPVVASNVGGIPDVVKDGETGLLVPSRNPTALADAIVKILKDKKRADEMGLKAHELMKERFSSGKMLEETLGMYEEVLSHA